MPNLESPNKPTEVFSPVGELEKISKSKRLGPEASADDRIRARAERNKNLEEYQGELTKQKELLALIQEEIIGEIRKDPDCDIDKLYKSVEGHNLTQEQKDLAKKLLESYDARHRAVRLNRGKYPENRELYRAVFGKYPEGEIKVIEGPITLYFRCKDIRDYTHIHDQDFSGSGSNTKKETPEEIEKKTEHAKRSGGLSIHTSLIPELRGTIIAENSSAKSDFNFDDRSEEILKHEEQHSIKKLFSDTIEDIVSKDDIEKARQRLLNSGGDDFQLAMRSLLKLVRRNKADRKAKDEILAYFKQKEEAGSRPELIYDLKNIFRRLVKTKEKDGRYDYLADLKPMVVKKFNRELGNRKTKEGVGYDFEKEVSDIFIKDYQKTLVEGLAAIKKLSEADYSNEQIMAILIQEPLVRWKKVVNRLIEGRDDSGARGRD